MASLIKPISIAEHRIAKKCGWKNIESTPVRKNVLPEGFVGTAKVEDKPITIGTRLDKNNITAFETIMGNNKLFHNPFIKTNLTAILEQASTEKGPATIKRLLKDDIIDKIDSQRRKIKTNPKAYIHDKDIVKYVQSPAGLNSVFNDINILKAAYVFDEKKLDKLFRMDITQGAGKKILDSFEKIQEPQLTTIKVVAAKLDNPEDIVKYTEVFENHTKY